MATQIMKEIDRLKIKYSLLVERFSLSKPQQGDKGRQKTKSMQDWTELTLYYKTQPQK